MLEVEDLQIVEQDLIVFERLILEIIIDDAQEMLLCIQNLHFPVNILFIIHWRDKLYEVLEVLTFKIC